MTGVTTTRPEGADYTRAAAHNRVVADHRIMGGVPGVRGTRIPVATVVGLLAQGRTVEQTLETERHLRLISRLNTHIEQAATRRTPA